MKKIKQKFIQFIKFVYLNKSNIYLIDIDFDIINIIVINENNISYMINIFSLFYILLKNLFQRNIILKVFFLNLKKEKTKIH